jgi:NADPH2:quinone reductase
MQAWVCEELTGEDGLVLQEQESAACGPDQIRIKNYMTALNYPDVLITRGQYQMKLDPPFIPGSECAGEILELGENVSGFKVGQRVMAMTGFGAFAQELLVSPPMQQLMAIPESMSFEDAASFNMVYGTAMHGLEQRGNLKSGETVLVLGSAGGCGSAAVQIAKAMGATVIAAASTDEKCAQAKACGADETVNYGGEQNLAELAGKVKALTDGKGVDIVFDPVGDVLFKQAIRCMAWNGRYLVIGFAGGEIPQFGINYSILKSISVVGVAYGMSAIYDPAMNQKNFKQLFDWYDQGLLKPLIGQSYAFTDIQSALDDLKAGRALGKLVVRS